MLKLTCRAALQQPDVARNREHVDAARSQPRSVVLPLLFQLRYQGNEAWVLSEVIQIRIIFKHGITRKAVVCRRLEPVKCRFSLFHQRVSAGNIIGSVMKVTESLPFFYCFSDLPSALVLSPMEAANSA